MKTIDLPETDTEFARLVDEAAGGEPFVIARDGKPLVKVVALDVPAPFVKRRLGFLKGQISVPDDFDTMGQDEIIRMFEGEDE
ncbi:MULTISPECIES: type II toxin-antitoxin system Phd/YefM family antitoxin [Methylobacterium]|uniref:Antitoxin n=1 Tax=Methylobacterium thuringiense TaxID=1003091 RepID=A0ABQ4TP01_9HYPH|nr:MULTISPECIES: type II toxin-antitoxin system prevent-host-death family antitoxin [Methylobacterium]TXN22396.1 type II toxin-antitoxin system prevent-host-death family antitoxin [Methylobacterium sp. WL9]GJE55785.1 hypothetical protein EKPJFOCH_2280 [Methylobacterium thuringiense]